MYSNNQTRRQDFILLGLTNNEKMHTFLFVIFSLIYTASIMGNVTLTVLTQSIQELKTPMYSFICNLSLLDMAFTSVTVPKMLAGLLLKHNYIYFAGCFTQMFFFHFLGSAECFLLSIMGYDRYVAICHPLRYSQIMSRKICFQLAFTCWLTGFLYSFVHTIFTLTLSFCASREVNHFFCDMPPLLKLSCTDTRINFIVILGLGGLAAGAFFFLLTVISYICIISVVFQIRSIEGKRKAFSTCASHLMVVIIFFGTIIMYFRPQSSYAMEHDKFLSVFYNVITPMLNPITYSMRNKEVRLVVKKIFRTK
ncbi:olfactory receptor 5AP2-like [Hyperolius riggenbachi]|uniref:olfactory receptor 5AP2-like n=1 Tax=Hyperolius riggenbachi TaxID=752182 RepID=UPI0035A2F5FB